MNRDHNRTEREKIIGDTFFECNSNPFCKCAVSTEYSSNNSPEAHRSVSNKTIVAPTTASGGIIRLDGKALELELMYMPSFSGSGYGSVDRGEYMASPEPLPISSGYMKDVGRIANIMSIILTCNMFSFPWSFYQSGICFGTLIMITSATVSCSTALALHRSQHQIFLITGKVANYSEIAQYYLGGGWWLSSSVQVATAVSCFGGCIGFYIFVGQILSQLLEISLQWANIILFFPLVSLSLSRSFKDLSIYTIISVFSFFLVIAVMYQDAFIVWYTSSGESNPFYHHIHIPRSNDLKHTPDIRIVVEFIGNATFLFAIHYCLLSQGAEDLEEQLQLVAVPEGSSLLLSESREYVERCHASVKTSGMHITISFVLSTCVSILVGITGHLFAINGNAIRDTRGHVLPGCENIVCENVILNIPPGMQRNVTNVILILSTMISYVLLLAPVREYIETIAMDKIIKPCKMSTKRTHWTVNMLRIAMVLSTEVIATEAPYFANVLGTVGGITDSYLANILPSLIMIMVLHRPFKSVREDNISRSARIETKFALGLFYFICLWGAVLASSTIYGLLVDIGLF